MFYDFVVENKFAVKLKELRLEKDLSQKDLAQKLGVSSRVISYYEDGSRECGFDMLIKISRFFGVSTDFLLGITDY